MTTAPLRLGISRCLLGDAVRYDSGHKRDAFLTEVLGRYVEWVPVCPEVEAGLGTPRETMRLVGAASHPRLMTIRTGKDHTPALLAMAEARLRDLDAAELSGYVFKRDSPSCGLHRVRLYNDRGGSSMKGVGLFAQALTTQFPSLPVEEEGRLNDPSLREQFIERVFGYRRWQDFVREGVTRSSLVAFHTRQKYVLMAHSITHYQALGRLVAQADRHRPETLAARYEDLWMQALAVKTTVRKHVNVLQHLVGHFKTKLDAAGKRELSGLIGEYHRGLVPLSVPLTLITHYARVFQTAYLQDQVYLAPHPMQLWLRNHV